MKNRPNIYRMYFATMILTISIAIILYVNLYSAESEFSYLLMLIAGFLFLAGLDSIRALILPENSYTQNNDQLIYFNEVNFYNEINKLKGKYEFEEKESFQGEKYQPSTFELVGIDNSLALAKVRMDIENELRRMIEEANISDEVQIKSAKHMSKELSHKEFIPSELAYKIDEIVTVCNKAIHGFKIDTDTTMKTVRASQKLLELMRRTQFNEKKTAQNKVQNG